MSVAPLAIEISLVAVLTAFLLHRYGNWRKQHILVTLATFTSWYFSLMIVFMLPLDVSSTFYRQCLKDNTVTTVAPVFSSTTPTSLSNITTQESTGTPPVTMTTNYNTTKMTQTVPVNPSLCGVPWSYVPDDILPNLWHVVYWTSQVLTWLILPMMQSYANAGAFTILGKIRTALIENAIFYGSYLVIFVVILIYVAASPDLELDASKLKVIGITASNTWGLFLLVLLLGYGLVEVPRSLWFSSNVNYMLSQTQFKVAKLSTEKSEAEEELEDVLEDIKKASDSVKYNHPLRKHVDTILKKCPESMKNLLSRNMDDYEDYEGPSDIPTEKSLVRLHKKIITASQSHHRTQTQWEQLMKQGIEFEDILYNEKSGDYRFKPSLRDDSACCNICYNSRIDWLWKCVLRFWVLKLVAVILCLFSVMVVWSEIIFFVQEPVLSLFAIFVKLAADYYNYLYIEIACCATIAYLCVCAYYTVFKIRVFNYYYIAPHHQTDENSLLFSGMLLCRLTPPLCLNFLSMIHLDSHVTVDKHHRQLVETYYTEIMGHMDVISFISDGFNIYFPIAIILLCIATYFHLGSRCLHCLGFQQFIGDDDITQELIDEGREHIKREKRKYERQEAADDRRRNWDERFGDLRSSNHKDSSDSDRERKIRKKDKVKLSSRSRDSDRTELLGGTEPVDYTGNETIEDLQDGLSQNLNSMTNYSSRNTRDYASTCESDRINRFSINRPSSNRPPKGIFDDI